MSVGFVVFGVLLAGFIVFVAYFSELVAKLTKIPSLIFYLLFGLLIGPIGLRLLLPDNVLVMQGQLLELVVSLAIAIIAFESGYSFNRCIATVESHLWPRLTKRECRQLPLRHLLPHILRLSLIAGTITGVLMTLVFLFVAQFPIGLAVLCGILCSITGPTVINPIIRELKIKSEVGLVLEGEGLFNDVLGVAAASAIFSALFVPGLGNIVYIPVQVAISLGGGVLVGLIMGFLGILLTEYIFPRFDQHYGHRLNETILAQLAQIGTLCIAFFTYGLGQLIATEAGLVSALVAGILLGQRHRFSKDKNQTPSQENEEEEIIEAEVHTFQLDLTHIAIAAIFIFALSLITPDILLQAVILRPTPFAGILIVVLLMLIIRPIAVLIATIRSEFTIRDRLFMSFLGPRGILIASTGFFMGLQLLLSPILAYQYLAPLLIGYIFILVFTTVLIEGGLASYTAKLFRVLPKEGD